MDGITCRQWCSFGVVLAVQSFRKWQKVSNASQIIVNLRNRTGRGKKTANLV